MSPLRELTKQGPTAFLSARVCLEALPNVGDTYRRRDPPEDLPLEEELELLPEDLDGDELLPLLDEEDRDGAEARGALRDDDDDDGLEVEPAFDPYERVTGLLELIVDLDGADARGDGALRLPFEVLGTIGVRLELEPGDEPVLGMTIGALLDGTVLTCPGTDREVDPNLFGETSGADRPTGRLELESTGILPVLGAKLRPDDVEGALVAGEDRVPTDDPPPPPERPRLDPVPKLVPIGLRVDR